MLFWLLTFILYLKVASFAIISIGLQLATQGSNLFFALSGQNDVILTGYFWKVWLCFFAWLGQNDQNDIVLTTHLNKWQVPFNGRVLIFFTVNVKKVSFKIFFSYGNENDVIFPLLFTLPCYVSFYF